MPFPVLQYKHTKDNRMFLFMDTVDTIMSPAMVVPCNIFSASYIEMDSAVRAKLGFYSIPYEFLCRDDWADIEQQGEKASAQGVNTQIYEQASEKERKLLLNNLMRQYPIQKNNLLQQLYDDDDDDE